MKDPDFNIRLDGESFPTPPPPPPPPPQFIFCVCFFLFGEDPQIFGPSHCVWTSGQTYPAFFPTKRGREPKRRQNVLFLAVEKFLGEECSSRRREGFSLAGGGFATVAWPLPHRRRFHSSVHDGFASPPLPPLLLYRILGKGFAGLSPLPPGRLAAIVDCLDQSPTTPTIIPNCAEVGAALLAISPPATDDCLNPRSSPATLRAPLTPRAPVSTARIALPAPRAPAAMLTQPLPLLLDAGTDYDPLLHRTGRATPQGLTSHRGLPDSGRASDNAAPFRVSLFLSILTFACSTAGD